MQSFYLTYFVYVNLHPHCIIYEGTCNCGQKYVGETDRRAHIRTRGHEDVRKVSEPSKHLKLDTWKILAFAPNDGDKRKILEAFFISKYNPGLKGGGAYMKMTFLKTNLFGLFFIRI